MLACGQVARPAREKRQARVEPLEELGRRQARCARGGELDRQREPIEARADALDRSFVVAVGGEVRVCLAGARVEERGSRFLGKRLHRVDVFAGEVQHDAARDEESEALYAREELAQDGRRFAEVLSVVEHEQELARPQERCQRLHRFLAGDVIDR